MRKESLYVVHLDKYERGAVCQSLIKRLSDRSNEDLPIERLKYLVEKLGSAKQKRTFGIGSPKYRIELTSDERRELVNAVVSYRSDLLKNGEKADVYGDVMQKLLYAPVRGVEVCEAR